MPGHDLISKVVRAKPYCRGAATSTTVRCASGAKSFVPTQAEISTGRPWLLLARMFDPGFSRSKDLGCCQSSYTTGLRGKRDEFRCLYWSELPKWWRQSMP